jgi:tripartite-type tricarboxylate transporter receptor subunit TctC
MTLRMIRCTTFVLLLLACSSRAVTAQGATDFPSKPITIVIPTAASVSGDLLMRAYGEAVSKHLGQPIIVENKPGGSGALAAAYVATSVKPDGYTLLNITIPIYRVPYIQKTPYDPVKDFTPIILLGGYTLGGVVKADSPFKEWKDVIEFSKANPGRFTYTTVGPQTTNAIAMETMARHSGVQFTHVPGKGGGDGLSAVLGGHVKRWWKARLGVPSLPAERCDCCSCSTWSAARSGRTCRPSGNWVTTTPLILPMAS